MWSAGAKPALSHTIEPSSISKPPRRHLPVLCRLQTVCGHLSDEVVIRNSRLGLADRLGMDAVELPSQAGFYAAVHGHADHERHVSGDRKVNHSRMALNRGC